MSENNGNPFDGAPIIFAYTRAQAIRDGVLVELKEAKNFGFRLQVVCTDRVYRSLIGEPDPNRRGFVELVKEARLLRTAYLAVKAKLATERAGVPDDQPDRLDFYVRTGMAGEQAEDVQLYMLIHPDDDGSMKPVATVMYPDED